MTGSRRSRQVAACALALAMLTAGRTSAQPNPPPAIPTQIPTVASPPLPQAPEAPVPVVQPPQGAPTQPPRFNLAIDPKTPVKDLLPTAPKPAPTAGPVVTDDLTRVPEVEFQAKVEKPTQQQAALQLARINHLNAKKTDAFMTALLKSRPDLAGLPFVMGDDCRASGARVKHFTQAAETVRRALGGAAGPFNVTAPLPAPVPANGPSVPPNGPATGTPPVPQQAPLLRTVIVQDNNIVKETLTNFVPAQAGGTAPFWRQYATFCEQEDAERGRPDKETTELVTLARLAALTQMLAAESADIRLGLVKYLTGVAHVEATRALARMAIFSPEDDIRAAALTALKVRREKDYTDTLVKGLRYPWPAVARRAADALVKLERTDLLPELVAVLDSADPRLPEAKGADGAAVVREVVKLNHHRNCAMCHAPSGSGVPNPSAIQAEVAVQGQPLPPPGEGYQRSTPELMIRIDVTYLRADFSAALPVKDAHPWPEAQRFDFLVRERTLTADEAVAYRAALAPKEPGVPSPYHKAALAALRELTGKDAAPTAEAWRTLLELPRR